MKRCRAIITALSIALSLLVAASIYGVFRNAQQETAESTLPPVVMTQALAASTSPASPPTSSSVVAKPSVTAPSASSSIPDSPVTGSVAPSPPTYLTIATTPGLTVSAKIDGIEYNDELAAPSCSGSADPDCPQKAYWIQDKLGVAPGSAESPDPSRNDSSYIVGHAWTQGRRVFDELSDYAMNHYDPTIVTMTSTDRGGRRDTVGAEPGWFGHHRDDGCRHTELRGLEGFHRAEIGRRPNGRLPPRDSTPTQDQHLRH